MSDELRAFVWATRIYEYAFIAFAPDRHTAFQMLKQEVENRHFPDPDNAEIIEENIEELPIKPGAYTIAVYDWGF